jgi:hypothetical protein
MHGTSDVRVGVVGGGGDGADRDGLGSGSGTEASELGSLGLELLLSLLGLGLSLDLHEHGVLLLVRMLAVEIIDRRHGGRGEFRGERHLGGSEDVPRRGKRGRVRSVGGVDRARGTGSDGDGETVGGGVR